MARIERLACETCPRYVSPSMKEWLRLALRPSVARRALGYAVVVGTILISINHGDAILRGDVTTKV